MTKQPYKKHHYAGFWTTPTRGIKKEKERTEGIIQKVFTNMESKYPLKYRVSNADIIDALRTAEQELIAEIKKAFPHSQLIRPDVQDKLIGSEDSKE